MLIDEFLSEFDFSEIHSITINSNRAKVNEIIFSINLNDLPLTKALFKLRGMNTNLSLRDFIESMFISLGNDDKNEKLFGLIGKFWSSDGRLIKFDSHKFIEINPEGYAKAVWNFFITEKEPGNCILTTETRVRCIGKKAKIKFTFYWLLIRPFSGIIRKEILKKIRRKAELF